MKLSVPQTTLLRHVIFIGALLLAILANAQSKTFSKSMQSKYDTSRLLSMQKQAERFSISSREYALQYAKKNKLPISGYDKDGNYKELQRIAQDGTPIYYTSLNTTINTTTRVSSLHANGSMGLDLDGDGMHIGIWDAGTVRTSHEEFNGRILVGDKLKSINNHATHVAGTLVASGKDARAKGIAYKATVVSYDWFKDEAEVIKAASEGMLISNHSYGIDPKSIPDWYFGSYIYQAYDWDKIMYTAPYYLLVVAAGNSQGKSYNNSPVFGSTRQNYDLMVGFALSKNAITVGATRNTKVDANGSLTNAQVASFTSFGPTDDGRIKPDIVGHGTGIYSTSSASNVAYNSITGTSAATPGISGALLLLQQHNQKLNGKYLKAATLKGLALHTADDIETKGPDCKTGWGVINAKRAAQTLSNTGVRTMVKELELTAGETYSITVKSDAQHTLMASISWTDAPGKIITNQLNDNTAVLVNDLDIRIVKKEETFFPWKLKLSQIDKGAVKGDNTVDPFEKIEVENAEGEYEIIITHKGDLNKGKQAFSLILTGIDLGIPRQKLEDDTIGDRDTKEVEATVSVFPNPSSDYINISNFDFQGNSNYQIVNSNGSVVKSAVFIKKEPIDISKLPTGIYVLVLQNQHTIKSKKFFKSN